MFYTERLMFRVLEPEADTNIWTQWLNDPEIARALTFNPVIPYSKTQAKKRLERLTDSTNDFPSFIICKKPEAGTEPSTLKPHEDLFMDGDKPRYPFIGSLNLFASPKMAASLKIVNLGIALSREYQNSGYGTEALTWALEYVFKHLGMHRLELRALASNERAIHVYEKVGFKREGLRRKQIWQDGQWQDVVEMAILEEEWFARQ